MIVDGMDCGGTPGDRRSCGGMIGIAWHGRKGWLLKPGDATRLTDAIDTLRADPALAQRFAKPALNDAR